MSFIKNQMAAALARTQGADGGAAQSGGGSGWLRTIMSRVQDAPPASGESGPGSLGTASSGQVPTREGSGGWFSKILGDDERRARGGLPRGVARKTLLGE